MLVITLPALLVLAVSAFLFFSVFSVETEKKKGLAIQLSRPLTDEECEYMETFPLMGTMIPANQEISHAHEALLEMELVTEEWSDCGNFRTISFTETGLAMGRSMRTSNPANLS